jgi:pimeloyl-ACP methyl ester carboxylesterase
VVAAPVGSEEACNEFRDVVDDVVCVLMPKPFQAVGLWYDDFSQTSDEEVRTLLARASESDSATSARASEGTETDVAGQVPGAALEGTLALPEGAFGIVVFAHGSGSSRHSPRNRMVANKLNQAGLGTLLIDLLTPAEEQVDLQNGRLRFDIDLLAGRVVAAVDWVRREHPSLPVGLFGASTGAAAALMAAAERPDDVGAIVSRGGRPDLAGPVLRQVCAPTLLIVGEADELVLELNRRALELLPCEKELAVVPGATHLFEEPGALEEVARLAADWFTRHLADGDREG